MAMKRNTKQKKLIKEKLNESRSHPTASEIFDVVRKEIPSISLGTVYRNLDEMVASGEALKFYSDKGPARFDGCVVPHYHVRCTGCDRLEDLPMDPDMKMVREADRITSFNISGCLVEFRGLCPSCRKRKEGKNG